MGGPPVALTSFVGRDDALREVHKLLGERRLVTLTGVGGSGKTRLAAQVAVQLADDDDQFADGVRWLDLGSVSDPALIAGLAAATLGVLVEPDGDPLQAITSQLRHRRLVFFLDTCEHVLDAAAALADALLRAGAGVSVLATSREPLGVAGEAVWRVPPLADGEAVRLFADRAALASPGFSLDRNHADVRAVCQRVDGIPLAVELAAAWVRALAPAQIADGLHRSFQLLAGGPRGALPRHQTLLASMEWSHRLLSDDEQVLFRRLSVFVSGFSLDAARAVCSGDGLSSDDVLAVLGRLIDKSLVVVRHGGEHTRYRLLDTVRQYASEQLRAAGEVDEGRGRHLDYFLAFAERAEPELERDQDVWRAFLAIENDEISAAVNAGLAVPDGTRRARRLCAAMARQWHIRGQAGEGIAFLTRAVDAEPAEVSELQARLHAGLAILGMVSGRRQLAGQAAAAGVRIAAETGAEKARARCLVIAAYRLFFTDAEACAAANTAASALAEAAGDPFARDLGRVMAAYAYNSRNRHDDAIALARTAFADAWPRRDRFCASLARGVEVLASMNSGDVRRSVTVGEEAVRIATPLGDYFAVGTSTMMAAWARGMAGEIETALRMMATVVRSIDEAPDVDVVGFQVLTGRLNLWAGDFEQAARWFRRGTHPRARELDGWTAARCVVGLAGALRRLGRLDEAGTHAEQALRDTRSFNTPLYTAESLDELGFLADDDPGRALDLHHEALALRRASGLRTSCTDSLDALALIEVRLERFAEAARLLAAGDAARAEIGYPRRPVDLPETDRALATLRAALGESGFGAAWAEGSELSLDDAVTMASRRRGRRNRPATGWSSLTPTELEVIGLISDGLSNPDIAHRMFISRATVKTHLSHIYAKLQVANRTELAMRARDRAAGGDSLS